MSSDYEYSDNDYDYEDDDDYVMEQDDDGEPHVSGPRFEGGVC